VKIESIRNVAIVAHVDHGKTTLVDAMLRGAGIFRANEQVGTQILDRGDLERERGITIMAKNTAIEYGKLTINIVDTPGHQDFSGEVERVLNLVDGILLIVDAFDGPMPQTRFVLQKALAANLKPVIVINKIDRPDARPEKVVDLLFDLFIELGAGEELFDFPIVYASARYGAVFSTCPPLPLDGRRLAFASVQPLLDVICDSIPCPEGEPEGALRLLIANIEYDPYLGRIAIGRVHRGRIESGQNVEVISHDGSVYQAKVARLMRFYGLGKREIMSASVGEIVAIAGITEAAIGETVVLPGVREALPFTHIDEPTIAMSFEVNDTIFAPDEATFLTSRHLRERLFRETNANVALIVEETDRTERFVVKGRGELHLSVLIETMRREGYALMVSKPEVILKEVEGEVMEPESLVMIDVPECFVGVVIEKLSARKGELISMLPPEKGLVRLEFTIPSRGLIGYRYEFLTDTRGNGILNSVVSGYVPERGTIALRSHGVLVADGTGEATAYGLYQAQSRGELFIGPGTRVYGGQIIGRTAQREDVIINVCRKKHVTNIRAAGSDEALRLSPPVTLSLEQAMELIDEDELVEVTPEAIRLRKRILNHTQRGRLRAERKKG
jgi:GTP-binding protein